MYVSVCIHTHSPNATYMYTRTGLQEAVSQGRLQRENAQHEITARVSHYRRVLYGTLSPLHEGIRIVSFIQSVLYQTFHCTCTISIYLFELL